MNMHVGASVVKAGQTANMQELPDGQVHMVQIISLESRVMVVITDRTFRPECLVRITWPDTMILGEVRGCRGDGTQFHVVVIVRHSISELGALRRQVEDCWGFVKGGSNLDKAA